MFYDTYNADCAKSSISGGETHSVEEQDNEDNINHVIFVIHGIGQQTERFGYFEQHMETIRKTICEVLQARLPDRDIRIQLIPIEWHKHIHEETDDCLDSITLSTIPGVRLVSNDYMMDALYYLAKDRQQSIVTHVTQSYNNSYHEFMDAHPTFNGNIGIFGYSLGGLITWDILAHQRRIETTEEQRQLDKLDLHVPRLDFKPQFLFGVGCPLGGFLNIRNQDPRLYHPDPSTVFENIYHPCDPLAYRVEPLYHPECRHHDSIRIETAIMPNHTTPLLSSLAGWVASWFTKLNEEHSQERLPSCTPQPPHMASTNTQRVPKLPPVTVNNTHSMNTPSVGTTAFDNTYSSDYCDLQAYSITDTSTTDLQHDHLPLNVNDNDTDTTLESTDRATLLSSVGALFNYISPRASFDRDSAIGSDDDDDDDGEEIYPGNHSKYTSSSSSPKKCAKTEKKILVSTDRTPCMNIPPPGIAAALVTDPMNDPSMLGRRRRSQIYNVSPPQSLMQKQVSPAISPSSSLKEGAEQWLHSLPGRRRLDYALQSGPILRGMVSNPYLISLQAHFSYWNNKDMLWRMVDQLDNATH